MWRACFIWIELWWPAKIHQDDVSQSASAGAALNADFHSLLGSEVNSICCGCVPGFLLLGHQACDRVGSGPRRVAIILMGVRLSWFCLKPTCHNENVIENGVVVCSFAFPVAFSDKSHKALCSNSVNPSGAWEMASLGWRGGRRRVPNHFCSWFLSSNPPGTTFSPDFLKEIRAVTWVETMQFPEKFSWDSLWQEKDLRSYFAEKERSTELEAKIKTKDLISCRHEISSKEAASLRSTLLGLLIWLLLELHFPHPTTRLAQDFEIRHLLQQQELAEGDISAAQRLADELQVQLDSKKTETLGRFVY